MEEVTVAPAGDIAESSFSSSNIPSLFKKHVIDRMFVNLQHSFPYVGTNTMFDFCILNQIFKLSFVYCHIIFTFLFQPQRHKLLFFMSWW